MMGALAWSGDLEAMAATLEASGEYAVLRRLGPPKASAPICKRPLRRALFVDTETTGLDPATDEIIEIAMVPFDYGLDGEIIGVGISYEALAEPKLPICAEVTALTGITNEMVAGRSIDREIVAAFVRQADLIVAHNAAFDRRFLERFDECFVAKAWACSMTQIDWSKEGFEGTKLGYLAMGAGFFFDRHRAANDCLAGIELLSSTLPVSGRVAMSCLLDRARRSEWRIRAIGAPFSQKDALKKRGYRWNGDERIGSKAWYRDVDAAEIAAEIEFLESKIGLSDAEIKRQRVTAFDRFSDRI